MPEHVKVVVAAGGTAGHVVPAMAVAAELRASGAEVSFLGTRTGDEFTRVPAAGFEIDFLKVRGIDRRNRLRAALAGAEAVVAAGVAARAIRRRGADVVMGGGGYVAGAAGLGAALTRVPLVLTEADSHLGLANRGLARFARRVCLAFPIAGREGSQYLVTGRPIPASVLGGDRVRARDRFGIAAEARCVLIVGGSQGARSVNKAALGAFAERPGREFAVIHITGSRDYAQMRERLEAAPHRDNYTLIESEPDLGDALAACDLVLGRSGGSIFEFTATGRPAVLVPYPQASAGHQASNAAWMEAAGAATTIADADVNAELVRATVGELLGDGDRLAAMAAASGRLALPDAARRIADEVLQSAERAKRGRR